MICLSCKHERTSRHKRGLCGPCYTRHWRRGTLDAFPLAYREPKVVIERTTYHRDLLLDEWTHLRQSGCNVEVAASRLGLKTNSLQRALHRAKARGDIRAVGFTKTSRKGDVVAVGNTLSPAETRTIESGPEGVQPSRPDRNTPATTKQPGAHMATANLTHSFHAPASESRVA